MLKLLCAFLTAGCLYAGVVSATYTGNLRAGSVDYDGYFGAAGGNYGGTAYIYSFSFDTSQCTYEVFSGGPGDEYSLCTSGSFSQSLTINGITRTVPNTRGGWLDALPSGQGTTTTLGYSTITSSDRMYAHLVVATPYQAGLISSPSLVLAPGSFVHLDGAHGDAFLLTDPTPAPAPAPTPEPSTSLLAFSALGAALIGFGGRRSGVTR